MAKEAHKEQPISNDCFVIMPIADVDGYNQGHFRRVYEDLFVVACEKAGLKAVRADEVKQTNLIHLDILQKLIESPMAICDLSNRNPNVLFELGLRQAFDKPTILVQEVGTPKIFDISPLRYTEYRKELIYREVLEDQKAISESLKATKESTEKGEGVNSIVSLLSLSRPAALKDATENDAAKMFQIVMSEMNDLRADVRKSMNRIDDKDRISDIDRQAIENNYGRRTLLAFEKLREMVLTDQDAQAVKEAYDHFQFRLLRYLSAAGNHDIPVRYYSMRDEAEKLLAIHMSKGDRAKG